MRLADERDVTMGQFGNVTISCADMRICRCANVLIRNCDHVQREGLEIACSLNHHQHICAPAYLHITSPHRHIVTLPHWLIATLAYRSIAELLH